MTEWRLINSGPCDASYNMALDEAISSLVRRGHSPPTLRFYGWDRPSLSLGAFQKTAGINTEYCACNNIPVVRRITGGRAVLHGDELTYSFSSQNDGVFSKGLLETYRLLSSAFVSAMNMMGLCVIMKTERESGRNLCRSDLCFKSASYGEISLDTKKIVGSAQKRWQDGFLQQGSIPYSIDIRKLLSVFVQFGSEATFACVKKDTDFSQGSVGLRDIVQDFSPEAFMKCLRLSFEKIFGVTLVEALPSDREQVLALQLAKEKYPDQARTPEEEQCIRFCNSSGIRKRTLQG